MSRSRIALLAAVCALVAAPAPATAQAPPPDITDAEFLGHAAQSNQFEIVTGRQAARHGRTAIVRRLGRMFARHHTAALKAGAAVAAKLRITPPAGLNPKQQATAERLARLHGRRFDRAWIRAQLLAHEEAIALHIRGALNGDTLDVRLLATLGLPVVSQHLGQLTLVAGVAR